MFAANRINRISVALPVERNSGMDRCDLANLTASVAVADQPSSRGIAVRRIAIGAWPFDAAAGGASYRERRPTVMRLTASSGFSQMPPGIVVATGLAVLLTRMSNRPCPCSTRGKAPRRPHHRAIPFPAPGIATHEALRRSGIEPDGDCAAVSHAAGIWAHHGERGLATRLPGRRDRRDVVRIQVGLNASVGGGSSLPIEE
jgi:hypothetical protein